MENMNKKPTFKETMSVALAEAKEQQKINNERTEKMKNVGNKINRIGKKLTVLITLPVIGFVFFGIVGLVVALIIGAIVIAGMNKVK